MLPMIFFTWSVFGFCIAMPYIASAYDEPYRVNWPAFYFWGILLGPGGWIMLGILGIMKLFQMLPKSFKPFK